MGHLNTINLSLENEHHQDHLLIRSIKDGDGLPHDHFWNYVYSRYIWDIETTGNDYRFAFWHPWVAAEFHKLEELERHISPPITLPALTPTCPPQLSVTCIPVGPPPGPEAQATPEPSGFALLMIAVVVVVFALGRFGDL